MKNAALALVIIAVVVEGVSLVRLNQRLDRPFRADLDGVAQIMVCSQPKAQGQILFGMANDCRTIAQKGMAKVVIQSVTANHGVLTLYQRGSARASDQTAIPGDATMLELNKAGSGGWFWTACDKAESDSSCKPEHIVAGLRGDGILVVRGLKETNAGSLKKEGE